MSHRDARTPGNLALDLDVLDFSKGNGLVTVVVQDARSGDVLMVAHADREALEKTIDTGELHLRSRTRGPWKKGETSGNVMRVRGLAADCDGDALVARVVPSGPACHTGDRTCFAAAGAAEALGTLDRTIASRATGNEGAGGWTKKLLGDRNLRLKKIGEESSELVVALADGDRVRAVEEAADLLYHSLVALRALGVGLDDVRLALDLRAAGSST